MWNDVRIVWSLALVAIGLLLATWWLLRRGPRRRRPRAAAVCVTLSILLHGLLFWLVPLVTQPAGGRPDGDGSVPAAVTEITLSDFNDQALEDASSVADAADAIAVMPLPIARPPAEPTPPTTAQATPSIEELNQQVAALATESQRPPTLDQPFEPALDELLSDLLIDDASPADMQSQAVPPQPQIPPSAQPAGIAATSPTIAARAVSARVVGGPESDFANRAGDAKQSALLRSGGDAQTEAAVEAALRWLAHYQLPDGSWDPVTSGGGQERAPLGETRAGAGTRATSAITGLALLTMLGSGSTHREGPYAENVHAGLSYLIRNQAPDGSLAGPATRFAKTYAHGMASLALCEAAAMTGDPQALAAARAAIAHTQRQQHPGTGGWRYQRGEPGDTSQLGWQAMALNSATEANIFLDPRTIPQARSFLRSVRAGNRGGLACYRPGQPPSRTMTAEALAIRLLLDEAVPQAEIQEAEAYLLQELPGDGQANYYYWYYASMALHQLQDPAWETWNARLKQELLRTQQPDGSWPTDSVWGGYGGRVYTTAMAAMSLEVYYRHRDRRAN